MRSRWWLFLLALPLVIATAWPAYAGVLTSNSYTYLLRGKELDVPVDLLTQRGTQIVPPELLSRFGFAPVVEGEQVLLTRGPVTIALKLGEPTALIDGRRHPLKTGPVLLSGRAFVPVELLPFLGISLEVDGKFVHLTDHGAGAPELTKSPSFRSSLEARTARSPIRDGSQMGELEVTHLTRELLLDAALPIPWGTRMQLLSLVDQRTLLLTTLRNQSVKSMTLDPARLILVGGSGRQYDYLKQEIAVEGQVTLPVAPGAIRTSVLVYPEVTEATADLYYDPAGSVIGRLRFR